MHSQGSLLEGALCFVELKGGDTEKLIQDVRKKWPLYMVPKLSTNNSAYGGGPLCIACIYAALE